MKKILLLIAMAFILGCSANKEEEAQVDRGPEVNGQYPQDYNTHSAMNSLDYFGLYVADESAKKTSIVSVKLMPENAYIITYSDGGLVEGTFGWDETGSVVHLMNDTKEYPTFFVGEGYIKETRSQARFNQQDQ